MSPKELKTALSTLGWSRVELGRRTTSHPNSVTRWCTIRVPGPVAAYVALSLQIRETTDTLRSL